MKIFKTLILAFMIVLLGCASNRAEPTQPIEATVQVEIFPDCTSDKELKPDIEGWAPELSVISYVIEDIGYTKIFSGISVSDTTRLWNDLTIMRAEGVMDVIMFLNSPGGGAFDGIAIARHIMHARDLGMNIEIHASGIVASAAIPILSAGSKRFALKGTIFMVHEAALWKWPGRETASDIRSQAELMDLLKDSYLSIMDENTTTSYNTWGEMEGKTVWFDVNKAKDLGLIDKIE
jgi:ATP-dependent protease ClpP protease subunit